MMPENSQEHTSETTNLNSNQPPKEHRCYIQYFCGHILNYHTSHHTQWLVDNLEEHLQKKIRCTYPLYRYDPQNNKRNLDYIIEKPNLVCIVKLKNGQIIVGYSQPGISQKYKFNQKITHNFPSNAGIIFGLMNKKVFTLKTKYYTNDTSIMPTCYDDYYIIWGFSDFRIYRNQFFSNYGITRAFYEEVGNKSSNFQDFMMTDSQINERQTQLITYEIFQIQFEDDPILCQTLESACPEQL